MRPLTIPLSKTQWAASLMIVSTSINDACLRVGDLNRRLEWQAVARSSVEELLPELECAERPAHQHLPDVELARRLLGAPALLSLDAQEFEGHDLFGLQQILLQEGRLLFARDGPLISP